MLAGVRALPGGAWRAAEAIGSPSCGAPDARLDGLERDTTAGCGPQPSSSPLLEISGAFDRVHLVAARKHRGVAGLLTEMGVGRSAAPSRGAADARYVEVAP